MFPVVSAVALCASPGGASVGSLKRALVNSHDEVRAGGWVAIGDGGSTAWAPLNRLTFAPPTNYRDLFQGFILAYKARAPDEYRSASMRLRVVSGVTTIRLRLWPDDDHWADFVYELTPDAPRPIEMYEVFGPASIGLRQVLSALGAGVAFLLLVAWIFDVRADRRRRSIRPAPRRRRAVIESEPR
jgi:hypothetical protein